MDHHPAGMKRFRQPLQIPKGMEPRLVLNAKPTTVKRQADRIHHGHLKAQTASVSAGTRRNSQSIPNSRHQASICRMAAILAWVTARAADMPKSRINTYAPWSGMACVRPVG